jgi:hypothetical protein
MVRGSNLDQVGKENYVCNFCKIPLNKLSEVNRSGRSVVTLHDRKKILITEERTEEEGRDDPELQNEYNLTFLKCSSTSWLMTNC